MRPLLPFLLPSVLGVALLEKDNPGHQKFVQSEKCPLSRLEQHILEMRVYNSSRLFLPRLTDLANHYPGERFTVSKEKVCRDENPLCERSVRSGACIGRDTKWTAEMWSEEFVKYHERVYGFHTTPANDTNPNQILLMQSECRASCRKWLEDHPEVELPSILTNHDLYRDQVTDPFGQVSDICDLGEGLTAKARRVKLSMNPTVTGQSKAVPQLTKMGFEKFKIPKEIYATILTNRKKLLKTGHKWQLEYCSSGLQNCNKVYESSQSQECHEVSSERYWFLDLEARTKSYIFSLLKTLAEEWIGNKFRLTGTTAYGLRKYKRGATLAAHLDHMNTHVVSAILNIKQQVDSDWPLQIYDHSGQLHNVHLKPGEMIWYESAKLTHGRVVPLNGSYFENIFVHFMPASKYWFSHDFQITFGEPLKAITLEDLIEKDLQLSSSYITNDYPTFS